MRIGFEGRYIFDMRGGVAGLRQYSTQLLAAMLQVAPDNEYLLYTRQPLPEKVDSPSLVAAALRKNLPNFKARVVAGQVAGKSLPTAAWFQYSLPQAIRSDHLDVLHCSDFLSPFWNIPSVKTPRIITIHDLNVLRYPENFTPRTYWAWRLQTQISSRRADLILTDSESSKSDIVEILHVPADKVKVILVAADSNYAPANETEIERVKTKLQLDKYIFWVGSLMPQKNLERLIRAFAILKETSDLPHKLVLGGQAAWGSQRYKDLIADLKLTNDVMLPGFIAAEDLVPLYSGADLFVFPSIYEGFGLPPLEAMACGTAVAVSMVSSLPEVAGDAAEYFDPLDITDIANAMQRVLTNDARRKELQKLGLERAKKFSWHETARQTFAVYQEIAR